MKLSDYVVDFLANNGVNHVFYLIGGAITHLVDSSIDNKNINFITMHHEQAAAFAAEGYARCNGNIGAAMATSGPGATNLITGIGSCFFDSIPCLFITGQVNTYEYKFAAKVRQIGFQETDIVSIVRPITKGAKLVDKAEDIRKDLEWAINLAKSGRPGPVLLDIPMNIQRAEIIPEMLPPYLIAADKTLPIDQVQLQAVLNDLSHAERPAILIGGGVRLANASEELLSLVKKTKIPVVASLMGIDAFPHTNDSYVGMLGAYGNRSANFVIANTDFLFILGSRLDSRQTGTKPKTFARIANIVHVDVDPLELNRSVEVKYPVQADVKNFLEALNKALEGRSGIAILPAWKNYLKKCKDKFPVFSATKDKYDEIDPNEFIYKLSQYVDENAIITVDVGQHQMWVGQSFGVKSKQRVLISGGMGSMGFALPSAIGAAFLEPTRQIIVVVGDGGFQMNIQELQTIVRNNLNIKIVLLNNNSLGMVRQFQEIYFYARTEGTLHGYNNPNFSKIIAAYDIKCMCLQKENNATAVIKDFLQYPKAAVLEVILPPTTVVEPKLIVNDPIEDQDPKLSREEFDEMMLIDSVSR